MLSISTQLSNLIQLIVDSYSSIFVPRPHGSQKVDKPVGSGFVSSAKSTIKKLKESVNTDKPVGVYQNYQNVKVLPQHHGILNPRDKTQVRNCHKSEREKLRGSVFYQVPLLT